MKEIKYLQQETNHLAIVTNTKNGIATKISGISGRKLYSPKPIPVYSQSSHLHSLTPGDEVLFSMTAKGPFIIAKTRTKNGTLGINNGNANITIKENGEIKISNKSAAIKIHPDGKIIIAGTELLQKTKNDIKLNADRHIHLNSPTK